MTFVVAHRGSAGPARENTLDAFLAAADRGAPWVELDVRARPDGVPVVHHDRLPPDLPPWIPTLAEALATCAARRLGTIVEIKEPAVAPAVDRLLAGLDQPLLVSSFHPVALQAIAAAPTALLVTGRTDTADAIAVARDLGCVALHPALMSVDAALVASCRAAGLDVMPWTVNERADLERLIALEVAAIITDDVPLALSLLP